MSSRRERTAATPAMDGLLEQYGCGPIRFEGTADALYERHLMFDNVLDAAALGPRERYEAAARSVRDVLILLAAEGNVFPVNWGLPAAAGAARGYQAESARLDSLATTKAQVIAELERSFDHLSRSLAGMSDSARAADGKTWGRDMKVEAGITMALTDMHEHLGQLIAYARMNRIVPPWSR